MKEKTVLANWRGGREENSFGCKRISELGGNWAVNRSKTHHIGKSYPFCKQF